MCSNIAVKLPRQIYDLDFQKVMVESPKRSLGDVQLGKFPTSSSFRYWKTNFESEVCSGSGHPKEAVLGSQKSRWRIKWEISRHRRPFRDGSIQGFETLDARIASALKRSSNTRTSRKKVHLEAEGAKGGPIPPRQTCVIHEYIWVMATHESILDDTDLMNVTLRGNDVQGFDSTWDEVLLSIKETPQDHMLEVSTQ